MPIYSIADLSVDMQPQYDLTRQRAKAYLAEDGTPPDITVEVPDSVMNKYIKAFGSGEQLADYEYMLLGSAFYRELLKFDGMMLHSSSVVVDDKAYLFSAKSGTGKSTHTALWLELLGGRAYILNDDKPAVRYSDGAVFAYGTPFSGKHDISENKRVPVAGICFLERGEQNKIERISAREALPLLMEQTLRHYTRESMEGLLFVMDKILSQIPIYKMSCNMDISAAQLSYNTMKNEEK